MSEEFENVIQLIDEDGNALDFLVMDVLDVDDEEYMVLVPSEEYDEETEEDVPVLIVKVVAGEGDDEDQLEAVVDDDELDKVFNLFMDRMEEEEEE